MEILEGKCFNHLWKFSWIKGEVNFFGMMAFIKYKWYGVQNTESSEIRKGAICHSCYCWITCRLNLSNEIKSGGETELDNVMILFEWLPTLCFVMHPISLKFHCRYGMERSTCFFLRRKGYRMWTIACESDSHNLFIVWEDSDEYILKQLNRNDEDKVEKTKLFEDFILEGSEARGAQVSYAIEESVISDGQNRLCDYFNQRCIW